MAKVEFRLFLLSHIKLLQSDASIDPNKHIASNTTNDTKRAYGVGVLEDVDGVLAGGFGAVGCWMVPHELAQGQVVVDLSLCHLGVVDVDLRVIGSEPLAHIDGRSLTGVAGVLHAQHHTAISTMVALL